MKFIAIVTILAFAGFRGAFPDILACLQDSKTVIDEIFDIIESVEKNPWNPDPNTFKTLLSGSQKLLLDCAHIQVDLSKYNVCVDDFIPLFTVVKDLKDNIKNRNESGILISLASIGFEFGNSASDCSKHRTSPISYD